MEVKPKISLFVTDIDNTLFDWVTYYVTCFSALLKNVEKLVGTPYAQLAAEAKEVFQTHGSIEYPFVVQELPSVIKHYGSNIDLMLSEAVAPSRDAFLEVAENHLQPYKGVEDVLKEIKSRHPKMPMVALTDAPRYVAMWKMNKLGLLDYFDAIYGLPDPRIPTSEELGRVKVDPDILLKHLQQSNFGFRGKIRILPDEYEKPGTKGLKTVLMDYEMDEDREHRNQVLWAGDNLKKDVGLGERLGIKTAWASYGADISKEMLARLAEFSPPQNIHKNANLPSDAPDTPKPNWILKEFADILAVF